MPSDDFDDEDNENINSDNDMEGENLQDAREYVKK